MKENIITFEDAVARFCCLQMNVKSDIHIRASEMRALIFVEISSRI